MAHVILSYDIGTTGAKTCLFELDKSLRLLASEVKGYPLISTADGGSEQSPDDWWQAMCEGTRAVLDRTGYGKDQVCSISFCCQMQALILVDKEGRAIRNAMGYMDGRATEPFRKNMAAGFPKIESMNAFKLLSSLYITGGAAATAKDPLWKYHWVRENEPENFSRVYKWLDVRDYLSLRCTGNFAMSRDSAHVTFLYDTRPKKLAWSRTLCRIFDVNPAHLPEVRSSIDMAGPLEDRAAVDLGLAPGTPVFLGGGDITLIPLGSGCTDLNDTHAYVGTSGWVVANTDKRMVDVKNFVASISGAFPGYYNYAAEQETSGLCLQWVRDHLALDALGVYLENPEQESDALQSDRLYDIMNRAVTEIEPGSGGVIFTPWLHGNRSPREDPFARGMFFNIGLNTGKRAMIRAVLEGMAYHIRWMLEAVEKKVPGQDTIRLVGGGAKSTVFCQILADVTGRCVQVPEDPQNVGAAGAAIVCALGLNLIESAASAKKFIRIRETYHPDPDTRKAYNRLFPVFEKLYDKNKKLFWALNRTNYPN